MINNIMSQLYRLKRHCITLSCNEHINRKGESHSRVCVCVCVCVCVSQWGVGAAAAVDSTIVCSDRQHAGQSDFRVSSHKTQKPLKAAESQMRESKEKTSVCQEQEITFIKLQPQFWVGGGALFHEHQHQEVKFKVLVNDSRSS